MSVISQDESRSVQIRPTDIEQEAAVKLAAQHKNEAKAAVASIAEEQQNKGATVTKSQQNTK